MSDGKIDLNDLERPHPLDVGDETEKCAVTLIGLAQTLARQSNAHAFFLMLSALACFAEEGSDDPTALLKVAIAQLGLRRDDHETFAARFRKLVELVPPHDPTGSPVEDELREAAAEYLAGVGTPVVDVDVDVAALIELARAFRRWRHTPCTDKRACDGENHVEDCQALAGLQDAIAIDNNLQLPPETT